MGVILHCFPRHTAGSWVQCGSWVAAWPTVPWGTLQPSCLGPLLALCLARARAAHRYPSSPRGTRTEGSKGAEGTAPLTQQPTVVSTGRAIPECREQLGTSPTIEMEKPWEGAALLHRARSTRPSGQPPGEHLGKGFRGAETITGDRISIPSSLRLS